MRGGYSNRAWKGVSKLRVSFTTGRMFSESREWYQRHCGEGEMLWTRRSALIQRAARQEMSRQEKPAIVGTGKQECCEKSLKTQWKR